MNTYIKNSRGSLYFRNALTLAFARNTRGIAAVEFAIILPVLLILLLGIIQFGFLFAVQNAMNNAAREGTRAMAVATQETIDNDQAQSLSEYGEDRARNELDRWPFAFDTIKATCPNDPSSSGGGSSCGNINNVENVRLEITIAMRKVAFADILGLFSEGDMSAVVTMRKE